MNIVLLVLSCLTLVVAVSLLAAAVFTFATYDPAPLDRDTDKTLSLLAWAGGGWFIYLFVVTRYWHRCRLGRRFFYAGLLSAAVALACGVGAARGG